MFIQPSWLLVLHGEPEPSCLCEAVSNTWCLSSLDPEAIGGTFLLHCCHQVVRNRVRKCRVIVKSDDPLVTSSAQHLEHLQINSRS